MQQGDLPVGGNGDMTTAKSHLAAENPSSWSGVEEAVALSRNAAR